ncbi:HAD-IA family hydrolase [Paraburkholderia lacunae]|uniref:HAD family hydrolase n=1 Tax=Paraburkholderia lacunae TaxID=2211104 RepID=A0A370N3I0_9BURK|nr:HAD-IA family hydrolase [Paraburkholderia lacunae]RDJ99997.1 HAD family hydrolase [Paraburkholderia lacunae]
MTAGKLAANLALICDCDGVLIDSETIAGATIVRELEQRWPGTDVAAVVMPLLGFRTEHVLQSTASTLGRTLSTGEMETIHRTVQAAAIKAPMVDGIDAALANIPLMKACASNSFSDYVSQILERTGLNRFFAERLFAANMVANPKPAPDVYLLAAQRMAVEPRRCLVVEDSVAGATAAVVAGMTVLGYTGGTHNPEEQASKLRGAGVKETFSHMKQLPGLTEEWIREMTFTPSASTAE